MGRALLAGRKPRCAGHRWGYRKAGLAALLAAGCAGAPVKKALEDDARAAVAAMAADYDQGRADALLARFDARGVADFDDLEARVRDFFFLNRSVRFSAVVDEAEADQDKVKVRLQWSRTRSDEQGAPKAEGGRCELGFVKEPFRGLLVNRVGTGCPF